MGTFPKKWSRSPRALTALTVTTVIATGAMLAPASAAPSSKVTADGKSVGNRWSSTDSVTQPVLMRKDRPKGKPTASPSPTTSPSPTATTSPTTSPSVTTSPVASPTSSPDPSSSTSPTPTQVTEPAVVTDSRLSWAPPALVNPVDLHVKQGTRRLLLTTGVDYRIHLPKGEPLVVTNDFQIIGGRNVVLIGGEIRFTTAGRMLYIKGIAGQTAPRTVHIEGLKVGAAGDDHNLMTEGVNIDSQDEPHLTVRFQNYHQATRVNGYYKNADGTMGPHADIFQYWNGPYALQLDRVYGETNYQGVMHQAGSFGYPATYGQYVFRRTWFYGPDSGSMLYFYYDKANMPAPVIDRFYITPNAAKAFPSQTLYGLEDRAGEFTRLTSRDARPDIPILTGNPGLDYVSPGYTETPTG